MTALDTGPGTYAPSGAARRGGLTGVALRSLRHRPTASAATFVAAALGSTLIGTFATQAQTALSLHGAARADDRATLTILGAVVGAWGTLIVLFAVASTAGLSTLRRAEEIGLLRTLGATPRQARRLLTTEALAIVLVGAVAGAAVALGTGRLLFGLLRGRLVDASVPYGGGAAAVGLAALLVTGASLAAAHLGARRVTQAPPAITLREASTESGPMRWYRVLAGLVLTGYGAVLGVITVTVTGRDTDDPYAAMQTSGSSEILTGLGLALLAPVLLRWLATPLAWLLTRRATAAGQLAAMNTTRRARRLASVAAPVTVLMATATGGAFLATIDARTFPASVGVSDQVVDTVTLVNNVVIGMISLFTALMVANAYAAFTADRRGELRRLWLLGATPGQIRGSVLAEAGVVSLVGVVLGAVGAAATAVPFSIARHEGAVPDQIWIAPLVAGGVILLTVATAGVTVLSPVGRDRGTGR